MKRTVYYRIGEAARLLGMSRSSLRNWERLGLLVPVRSQGLYRWYSREDLQKLRRIRFLRHTKHVNPAGIAAIFRRESGELKSSQTEDKEGRETIASRLLRLRREAGLTLVNVAKRTSVSPSFLSALEHGNANPSIATLQKLARLYNTNVLSFFAEKSKARRLVRPADRKILKPNPGVRMELLALGVVNMEPHLFRIAPGATSGGSYDHEGEEFIFMLQGKLEIWLDEVERYIMEAGDSLYFESTQAHRWKNVGTNEALLLWVNTPPTF